MDYLRMRPFEIREAIQNNVPVILPLGIVEYHGEHLPVGVDTFVVTESLKRLEARHPEIIILPPFSYGTASYAVALPEQNGTVSVDAEKIIPVAEEIFTALIRVGFRNIHAFIAHQTEEFTQGMPTDLAFRFAARKAEFAYLDRNAGEGWWGTEKYSSYYTGENNPFSWIHIHPARHSADIRAEIPSDHAGRTETSETMAMFPELVAMDRLDETLWFCRPAKDATPEFGERALELTVVDMERAIYGEQ